MTTLIVGDPHLQIQRLDDGKLFIEKLHELSKTHDRIIILGDLFHSFALIRSEILTLWCHFFAFAQCEVVLLVGNHDYAGQAGGTHALRPFQAFKNVRVVEMLEEIQGIYFMPFVREIPEFEKICRSVPAGSVLFCHQSFNGAKFSTGFFDPHGAPLECVSHLKQVISGHIHSAQTMFNIWYPGSPFQQNFGEAGEDKHVYSVSLTLEGCRDVLPFDLALPRYIQVEADSVSELLVRIPEPEARNSYKFVAKGSPQEIVAFWQDEKVKNFRPKVRRVVDALVPERGQIILPGQNGGTKTEKREAYIKSRKWRISSDRLCLAASNLITH